MDDELLDEAIVVRGGIQRDPAILLEQVLDAQDITGHAVLSVHARNPRPNEPYIDTVTRICREASIRHGQVQVTRAGLLRYLGFTLVKDTRDGQADTHCHVIFPQPVQESDLSRFVAAMDGPIPNPHRAH